MPLLKHILQIYSLCRRVILSPCEEDNFLSKSTPPATQSRPPCLRLNEPTFPFNSASELWELSRALFVLSRHFCFQCNNSLDMRCMTPLGRRRREKSPTEESPRCDTETISKEVSEFAWEWFEEKCAADSGNNIADALTVVTATRKVFEFTQSLQRAEGRRGMGRRGSDPKFEATFNTVVAALAFQKSYAHQDVYRTACCQQAGFVATVSTKTSRSASLDSSHGNSGTTTVRSSSTSRHCAVVQESEETSRKIVHICTKLLNDVQSKFISSLSRPSFTPKHLVKSELVVLVRDCVAVISIIQKFCFSLFVASAWIDEQEPLSTTVLSSFLNHSWRVLEANCICRGKDTVATPMQRSRSGQVSARSNLKKLATGTTSSVYTSMTPSCLFSNSIDCSRSTNCAICLKIPASPPTTTGGSRELHGVSLFDFERSLFQLLVRSPLLALPRDMFDAG